GDSHATPGHGLDLPAEGAQRCMGQFVVADEAIQAVHRQERAPHPSSSRRYVFLEIYRYDVNTRVEWDKPIKQAYDPFLPAQAPVSSSRVPCHHPQRTM